MPRGASSIPALRLSVLNGLIERMETPPSLFFSKMFGTSKAASDTIEWETSVGNSGLAPFVPPGGQAPTLGVLGVGSNSAKAAYWKEKMQLDEEFLNNLRKPGTREVYESAQAKIARETQRLYNRNLRRREWMFAQMLISGGFSYKTKGGNSFTVDYGVPSANQVTLTTNYKWNGGSSRDILSDIYGLRQQISDMSGVTPNIAVVNSAMVKTFVFDANLRDLLKKSSFGNGDLLSRPKEVIASLIGFDAIYQYDETYSIEAQLTAAVPASATTTIYVEDTADFSLGKAYLQSMSRSKFGNPSKLDVTITAIDHIAGTVTITEVTPTYVFTMADKLVQRKKYIPDNAFFMMNKNGPDGMPIAEHMMAPFGLGRNYGTFVDTKEEWDPDSVWLRVQDKGLPVLTQPDCMGTIWVW